MSLAIVSSTNRPKPRTLEISRYYLSLLQEKNLSGEIIDLQDLPPDFVQSSLYHNTGTNEAFNKVSAKVVEAQKLVFVVPEYNGSFPGVLKAFIDGLPYPGGLTGKVVALVGLSAGPLGSGLAMSHLADIFSYLGCYLAPMRARLPLIDQHVADGQITHEGYNQALQIQIEQLMKM